MVFEVLFLIGFVGLLLMMLTGAARGHHGMTGGHHGSLSGGHRVGLWGHHGHAVGTGGRAGHHGMVHGPQGQGRNEISAGPLQPVHHVHAHRMSPWSFIPTPIDVLSLCLGAGLTGVLFRTKLHSPAIWYAAIIGALLFDFAIVRPMFAFAIQWASRPSAGLEGAVAGTAEVITNFDHTGKGLVKVNMDGQIVQLLARLEPAEVAKGVAVNKGDQVVLTEVNAKASTCTVTRELSL